jgi:predicted deacylase
MNDSGRTMGTAEPMVPTRTTSRIVVGGRRLTQPGDVSVIVLRGAMPGPTAVITANLHGDECTGLGVARRLDRWLRGLGELVGTVVLYPSCNPQGLTLLTRAVPVDDADLNRQFPGSSRGDWSARLAHALWTDIVGRRPDVLIDLHADAPSAIPYVIVDRPVRRSGAARVGLAARLLELAEATGLTVLREYPDEVYVQFSLDRSLAGAMVNLEGVPAITLEVGPRRHIDPVAVEVSFQATVGVLGALGMVPASAFEHPTRQSGVWRRASSPRARRAGLVEPLVTPGDSVRVGQVMARVFSLTGELQDEVVAAEAGIVVSWVDAPWVAAGGVVGTLGVPDVEPL